MTPPYVDFALKLHAGHLYADKPYDYHLRLVEGVLGEFGYTGQKWSASAWLHDTVEDCVEDVAGATRLLGVIREKFGDDVANLVWSVSGLPGVKKGAVNRKDRNEDIYAKLSVYPEARTLKCADRIVNVECSIVDPGTGAPNLGMMRMYLKERARFTEAVRPGVMLSLWNRLEAAWDRCQEIVDKAAVPA